MRERGNLITLSHPERNEGSPSEARADDGCRYLRVLTHSQRFFASLRMTLKNFCHSCGGRNPLSLLLWINAKFVHVRSLPVYCFSPANNVYRKCSDCGLPLETCGSDMGDYVFSTSENLNHVTAKERSDCGSLLVHPYAVLPVRSPFHSGDCFGRDRPRNDVNFSFTSL